VNFFFGVAPMRRHEVGGVDPKKRGGGSGRRAGRGLAWLPDGLSYANIYGAWHWREKTTHGHAA